MPSWMSQPTSAKPACASAPVIVSGGRRRRSCPRNSASFGCRARRGRSRATGRAPRGRGRSAAARAPLGSRAGRSRAAARARRGAARGGIPGMSRPGRHVAQRIAHADQVDRGIGERQRLGARLHQRVGPGRARLAQHAGAEVEADHVLRVAQDADASRATRPVPVATSSSRLPGARPARFSASRR